jgi:C4-dicarboxylate-specific signal transduction histidine kinase
VAQPLRRQIILLNVAILSTVFLVIWWSARETSREQSETIRAEAHALATTIVVYLERGLDIKSLQTVIREIPLPSGSVITITDVDSTVLARSVDGDHWVGRQATRLPVAPAEVPLFTQLVGVDGVERIFANTVYARGPWLVSVGMPTAVVAERVAPIVQRALIMVVGVAVFALLLEFALLRSYTRAFDRAILFARRVSGGDLRPPPPIKMPSREMEQLQESVIEMVTRMRQAREAIGAQVQEERRMREELESLQRQVIRQERLAAIGVLVSGVAHELNNPLQAILGFAELLQMRKDLPAGAGHELAVIQKESARASAIIRNLSRFGRQQSTEATRVRLRDVVASVVELRQRRHGEDYIRLDVVESGNPAVLAIFTELQQVVLNFVINAEQAAMHGPEPRVISITAFARDGTAHLEVQDSGPGVPPEDEPKLFQPFFTTKPVGEGTGLGLSVSYGIIQSHGGTIGYRCAPGGGGAVFYFDLPALNDVHTKTT